MKDPLGLINGASRFKNEVIFSGLLLMAIILAFFSRPLLATFPILHRRRDESDRYVENKSLSLSRFMLSFAVAASVLCLVVSLW